MEVYHEDLPLTTVSRAIDSLKDNRAEHCAAAIQMCLTTFDGKNHHLIMEPTRLTIAQIALTAGYPKAAVWRALPMMEAAQLLRWRKLDDTAIEVTWIMLDEEIAS